MYKLYTGNPIENQHPFKGYTPKELFKDYEDGILVLLKYDSALGNRRLHIYEYVCSELARTSGIQAQRTSLAYRVYQDGSRVECVAIELFEDTLHHFRNFGEFITEGEDISEITKKSRRYTIDRIFSRYREQTFIEDRESWISWFKDTILFDIVVGNSDRHADNIGFFKVGKKLKFSPRFDNGNSFANRFNLNISDLESSEIYTKFDTPYINKHTGLILKEIELINELETIFPTIRNDLIRMFETVLNNKMLPNILENVMIYNNTGAYIREYINKYLTCKFKYYKGEF